jgi:hypothetical protein
VNINCLQKDTKWSQVWWFKPIIPATWEAEKQEDFQFKAKQAKLDIK